ncbi:MAG: Mth938-like domain-containing protein [Candidatus Competibacteraceae bacterium]
MRLKPDTTGAANTIRAYDEGYIRINDQTIRRSLIVTPEKLITDWPPQSFSDLQVNHLEPLLALDLEIVLLGTGARQHFPHPRLSHLLLSRGVGLEVMDTAAACRTYNFIMAEGRRVAAALLPIRRDS